MNTYKRPQFNAFGPRIEERPRFIQFVTGPRQVGKTTLVLQVLEGREHAFYSTDRPESGQSRQLLDAETSNLRSIGAIADAKWLVNVWTHARTKARRMPEDVPFVLAIDEIQKIPKWSELVKGLWDEDRANKENLNIVLLGSSPLLMSKGMTESLAGRYEVLNMTHWTYSEMQTAFDFSLDQFIYFGGYPGSATLIADENRWRSYVKNGLIEPSITKDILQMERVEKPHLLRNLFELGCGAYSSQIVALKKLSNEMQDASHVDTLAHYLELLSKAGLLTGISKYAGQALRRRASPPKFLAQNSALISALANYTFEQARADRTHWGRLVESAVGAHLLNTKANNQGLYYWRKEPDEVDFILTDSDKVLAVEVKSSRPSGASKGLAKFKSEFSKANTLLIGETGIDLAALLSSEKPYAMLASYDDFV